MKWFNSRMSLFGRVVDFYCRIQCDNNIVVVLAAQIPLGWFKCSIKKVGPRTDFK